MLSRLALKSFAVALAAAAALTAFSSAHAQTVRRTAGDGADLMARPYGTTPGQENRPINGSTRDANGNRVIVNGEYVGSAYSSGALNNGVGSGMTGASTNVTAVGNLLNVLVSGNNNTVIVNSEQENSGDTTAIVNGGR